MILLRILATVTMTSLVRSAACEALLAHWRHSQAKIRRLKHQLEMEHQNKTARANERAETHKEERNIAELTSCGVVSLSMGKAIGS